MEKVNTTQFIGITNTPSTKHYDEMIENLRKENTKIEAFSDKVKQFIGKFEKANIQLIDKLEAKKQ